MKKFFLILAFILFFAVSVNAQMRVVTVKSGTSVFYYPELITAVYNAPEGSDIYIGGGVYEFTCNINKELHFYGVGCYPDSTIATGSTITIGNPRFIEGSDNSTISGINFTGHELRIIPVNGGNINNISITRCRIKRLSLETGVTNFKVSESIIDWIWDYWSSKVVFGCIIEKNIFINGYKALQGLDNAIIDHNIFLGYQPNGNLGGMFQSVTNSIFTNNIITSNVPRTELFSAGYGGNFNIIFKNNFVVIESFDPNYDFAEGQSNVSIDNQFYNDKTPADIFVKFENPDFDFGNDYHLKEPYNALTFSTDGTEIGIYGTQFPYKDGAVPVIPHYTTSEIGGELINGQLHINVTVEAQTK
ncbi:MAG: hypothetical protein A2X61_04810 [Ignavibacteria bacterium GWB2_35_12]|nr:MAG: hypothetical protein A2X63_06120 [Ignavibacteria bacterium GWA2_35_8]OGU37741.1 MAG: hypothetical protein A2X61_04810 [Ignavibacteria bacterium GWB2_35_12]OGU88667.1 MAG: hypothetical protein A2220_00415 [Ignavibacteria bacterium RIFOXYA2_FULL_35_10]OGV23237.1 MAG: hypothetical protein A2475_13365 [Ignavibacteria bacterium RIFOXYC2_FULL_35_21]